MNRILQQFEDFSEYKRSSTENDYLNHYKLLPLGILIEGINDFQLFTNRIQNKTSFKSKIIELFNGLSLILLDIQLNFFDKQIKQELSIFHYKIYSIFLKKRYSYSILREFNNINEKYFYVYFEGNNYNYNYSTKAKDIKFTSSNPIKFLFGFDNYNDLIQFYIEIITTKNKWPVFAIHPMKINYDQNDISFQTNETIEYSKFYSSNEYPIFSPIKFLHYFSFIEKVPPKPKRQMNITQIYSINKIKDVQISHKDSRDLTIRTFLGFETTFRCIHAFDYFIHNQSKKFLDIKLNDKDDKNSSVLNFIKYDLYYLELVSIFDSSVLFSINFKESFNFVDDSDNVSSFLCFDNRDEFLLAKQMLSSLICEEYLFKNMKMIEKNDLSVLFPNLQQKSNQYYIMFRLKCFEKKKLTIFSYLFKGSVNIIKNNICSLDGKAYIVVGFVDIQKRNKVFQLLKQSSYLIALKSYYPENKPNIKNKPNYIKKVSNKTKNIKEKIQKNLKTRNEISNINKNNIDTVNENNKHANECTNSNDNSNSSNDNNNNSNDNSNDNSNNSNDNSNNIKDNSNNSNDSSNNSNDNSNNSNDNSNNSNDNSNNSNDNSNNSNDNSNNSNDNSNNSNDSSNNSNDNSNNSNDNSNNSNDNSNNSNDSSNNSNDSSNSSNDSSNSSNDSSSNNNNSNNNGNNDSNNINENHKQIDNYTGNNNSNENKKENNKQNYDIIKNKENKNANLENKTTDIKRNIEIYKQDEKISHPTKIINNNLDKSINIEKYIVDLKDYKIVESGFIGNGSFGSVYLVENIHTHKKYAAKVKSKQSNNYEDFIQEIKFYTSVKFAPILALHGYSMKNFENQPKPTLILEYMPNKSLAHLFKKTQKIMQTKKYTILWGIIWAMTYLHKKGIVHRDLKPGNILLDENYYPRVSDFGSSIMYNEIGQSKKKTEKNVGSPMYMAPEIFLENKPYSFKVDVYSFSMIAYELLTGVEPFSNIKFKSPMQLIKKVIDGVRPDLSIIHDDEIRAFFGRCWSNEPSERPDFLEIMNIFQKPIFKQVFHFDDDEFLQYTMWQFNNSEETKLINNSTNCLDELQSKIISISNLHSKGNKVEATKMVKKIADGGDRRAMYIYAQFLTESSNKSDQQKANIYFKKSADCGFDEAMVEYGNRLLKGIGCNKNEKEAVRYYKMAADIQSIKGINNYAYMLLNGIGVKKDLKEAAIYFQLSADLGNVNGMFQLAVMLRNGLGIKKDIEKSVKYYEKAIEQGDKEAMMHLGTMYYDGTLPDDYKKSQRYLKMAINLGFINAKFNYANLLCKMALTDDYSDIEKVELYEKAARYYRDFADNGNIEAAAKFGCLLQTNNMELVKSYLKKAAYKGNEDAIIEYGKMLYNKKNEFNDFKSYLKRNGHSKKKIDNYVLKIKNSLQTKEISINKNENSNNHIINNNNNNQNGDVLDDIVGLFRTVLFSPDTLCDLIDEIEIDLKQEYEDNNISGITEKNINEIKLNSYEIFDGKPKMFCIYISHFTVHEKIRKQIYQQINRLVIPICKENILLPLDPNDIYTFYFLNPLLYNSDFRYMIANVMLKYHIKSFFMTALDEFPFKYYLHFNELLIPKDILIILIKLLETHPDVISIQRNIFDGSKIATYIIVKKGTHSNIIKSIRTLLTQHEILFKSFVYPLQNNIIINEKMILQDKNDFNVILKEIKLQNYKPIHIERNSLYLYDNYFFKKLFQRFSFICFKNEIEKMEVVNHLNSIIFNNKENILQYDINLHYASINENQYSQHIIDFIPDIFNGLKGIKDIQRNVVSIESPFDKTFIGFDSIKHLKKCYYKIKYRMDILCFCKEPKLFCRKKNLDYACIRSKNKFNDTQVDKYEKIISNIVSDIQINCTDLEYSSNENMEKVFSIYLGFENIEKLNEAIKILSINSPPEQNDLKILKYKEGHSYINISNETKEFYLFYECL